MSSADKAPESARSRGRPQTQSQQRSSSHASRDNRQFNRDGSVSAMGLFDGLSGRQAKKTLDAILEEYNEWRVIHDQNIAKESGLGGIEDDPDGGREKRARDAEDDDQTSSDSESEKDAKKEKARKTLERLRQKWLKRGWILNFERYSAIPELKLTPESWNKLLEFLWTALSKDNMVEVQFLLLRVRSAKMLEIDWTFRPDTGTAIDEGQTTLFAAYDQIRNCNAEEHLHNVLLRFHLVRLFESHEAEVHRRMQAGTAENEARKLVNASMVRAFKNQHLPDINIPHLKRKLLQGKHWTELVRSESTKDFGFGLLLLLPQANAVTIAQNTPYEVWKFLLTRFAAIDPYLMLMSLALQPLGESVYANGICNHDVSLFGYELLKATDLRDHSAASYKTYWRQYPQIPKHSAMELMQLRERSKDIDVFPRLLEQDWQQSNKEEVQFIERQQKRLVAESEKRIQKLEFARKRAKAQTFTSRATRNPETEGESSASASRRGRIPESATGTNDRTTQIPPTARPRSKRPRHHTPTVLPSQSDQPALALSSNPTSISVLDPSSEVVSSSTIPPPALTSESDPIAILLQAADRLDPKSSSSINQHSTTTSTIPQPANPESLELQKSAGNNNTQPADTIQTMPPPPSSDSNPNPSAQLLPSTLTPAPTALLPDPHSNTIPSESSYPQSENHVRSTISDPTHAPGVSQLFHQDSMEIDQGNRNNNDNQSTSEAPRVFGPERPPTSTAQRSRQSASALRSYRSPMPSPSIETLRRALYSNSLHTPNPETHRQTLSRPAVVASAVLIIQSTQTTATGNSTSSRVDQPGNLHLAVTQIDIQVPNSQGIGWQNQQSTIPDTERFMELDDNQSLAEVIPDTQLPPTQPPNEHPLQGNYRPPAGTNIIPEDWDALTDQEWNDIFNKEMAEADWVRDLPSED